MPLAEHFEMITRRKAVRLLGSASVGTWFAASSLKLDFSISPSLSAVPEKEDSTPALAPGAPTSPERIALIDTFKKQSEGLQEKFEPRTHKSDWVMPYRLFRPEAPRKLPLVLYLHVSYLAQTSKPARVIPYSPECVVGAATADSQLSWVAGVFQAKERRSDHIQPSAFFVRVNAVNSDGRHEST